MQEINKLSFDMATVAKSIEDYSGEDSVYIETWPKEVMLLGNLAELDDQSMVKLLIFKLKGKARSYIITMVNGEIAGLTLSALLGGLRSRFVNSKRTDEILENF
ncbi:hypothetical protein NGRA_2444 [Nosema granulosis]|uniref:Uncharacterized protein n=1 Tax=Nosema granulosis TaxID=83296 RepID=A0A9P6GWL2_9MICR|nr:hypothetical protein NGRA_2444 [Nosema granulosis]